ncbi:MAG TPA: hypothetical protein DC063_08210 [Arenimonas sp.]|nr:MAG: hypothetical protein A2X76_11230 [Xanthomonadales bacterium GWF1_69_6]HBD20058.1 hypothetical protein [Arenimonas sp.]
MGTALLTLRLFADCAHARLQALGPGDWTTGGDDDDAWAVWNRAEGRAFLLPAVAWAEAQFTRRDD